MSKFKKNILLVIIFITVVISAYVYMFDASTHETNHNSYLLKSGKTINIKYSFSWAVCDADKYTQKAFPADKKVFESYVSSMLKDGIRHKAASSNSFLILNTNEGIKSILNIGNERAIEYGVCIKNLKLYEASNV